MNVLDCGRVQWAGLDLAVAVQVIGAAQHETVHHQAASGLAHAQVLEERVGCEKETAGDLELVEGSEEMSV